MLEREDPTEALMHKVGMQHSPEHIAGHLHLPCFFIPCLGFGSSFLCPAGCEMHACHTIRT